MLQERPRCRASRVPVPNREQPAASAALHKRAAEAAQWPWPSGSGPARGINQPTRASTAVAGRDQNGVDSVGPDGRPSVSDLVWALPLIGPNAALSSRDGSPPLLESGRAVNFRMGGGHVIMNGFRVWPFKLVRHTRILAII